MEKRRENGETKGGQGRTGMSRRNKGENLKSDERR